MTWVIATQPDTSSIKSSPPPEGHVIDQCNICEAKGENFAEECKNQPDGTLLEEKALRLLNSA